MGHSNDASQVAPDDLHRSEYTARWVANLPRNSADFLPPDQPPAPVEKPTLSSLGVNRRIDEHLRQSSIAASVAPLTQPRLRNATNAPSRIVKRSLSAVDITPSKGKRRRVEPEVSV